VSELFGSFGPVSSVALHASQVNAAGRACRAYLLSYAALDSRLIAFDAQTAAIVTFTQHSSVKKVMAAAQAACPVQLRMRQPEQPYGLKGELDDECVGWISRATLG
jgi:hypothetical protein